MHPILEAILIALTCGLIVFAAGALIGIIWFAMERDHEADTPPAQEIPEDREFTDLDTEQVGIVAPRDPSGNSVLSPQSSRLSPFPHDLDYQNPPTHRF